MDLLKRKGQEGAELQSDRCPLASVVGNQNCSKLVVEGEMECDWEGPEAPRKREEWGDFRDGLVTLRKFRPQPDDAFQDKIITVRNSVLGVFHYILINI